MHYKNGREAKNGDVVLNLQTGKTGVIYNSVAGIHQCSARLAVTAENDEYIITKNCLHLADIASATVPDLTAIPAASTT